MDTCFILEQILQLYLAAEPSVCTLLGNVNCLPEKLLSTMLYLLPNICL